MKEPTTEAELLALHKLGQSDPRRLIEITSGWIDENPNNSHAYFHRHYAWMDLGEPNKALEDMNKAVELKPDAVSYVVRAQVHRAMGNYLEAIADYSRAEAADPVQWQEDWCSHLYQADCFARMGNEAAALTTCARLPEDFWTPGPNDTPPGDKHEVAQALRHIAAQARRNKS